MATLTRDTQWTATEKQTYQDKTYTISTANKYVDKDIKFNISVPGIVLKKPTSADEYTSFYVQVEGDTTKYVWKVDSSGNIWVEGEEISS